MALVESFISHLFADARFGENIISTHIAEARDAQYAPFPEALNPRLIQLCQCQGIEELYSHQAEAIRHILAGENVVISTGVASGKSLAFQLPILQAAMEPRASRALLLYPTKALAQDQLHKMQELIAAIPAPPKANTPASIYDGDTPSAQRSRIRKNAQIIFSNADMLHLGILPNHSLWSGFFSRLRYIVIDEVHYYRGVFGSHLANVLRRLLRICRIYGSKPIFICSSATIANARDFVRELLDQEVILIEADGSPAGKRVNMIYNPPLVQKELGLRRSSMAESAQLAKRMLDKRLKALLFSVSRRSVEMLYRRIASHTRGRVAPYRSGYLPEERRQIEQDLRSDRLGLVISTNALELGIDIGSLDAVLINGYPGAISAVRQESGRAGRKANTALSILITGSSPLDQYICQHPEYLWENNPEHALIDPNNTQILLAHLACAATELAFKDTEDFGSLKSVALWGPWDILVQDKRVRQVGDKYMGIPDTYPAEDVNLRGASSNFPIMAGSECIGFVDEASTQWMTHPGAIYLQAGECWIVRKLDSEAARIEVEPIASDYYTQATQDTQISAQMLLQRKPFAWGDKYLAEVLVLTTVTGFKKIRFSNLEIISYEKLTLPTRKLETVAWWLALNPKTVQNIRERGLWNSDPISYGADWQETCNKVKRRDGNRCTSCGAGAQQNPLHVHHIVPFRKFIKAEDANALENLTTLCPRCHHLAEERVRIQSGIHGLAFLLWNLAPFFVMCDLTNLGMHSELDSPLAQGNPIIALYDMIPGGIGLAKKIYDLQDIILKSAYEQLQNCPCEDGCPSCVGPVSENGEGAKAHAAAILEELLLDTKPSPQ
ncbi:MAG: DEAD/DEAH box helicase [Candidatus Cloacimonetes bacterium]|nr:DEAD/DEAH box helicase [Candidatus Cloacimonadota bacterium]